MKRIHWVPIGIMAAIWCALLVGTIESIAGPCLLPSPKQKSDTDSFYKTFRACKPHELPFGPDTPPPDPPRQKANEPNQRIGYAWRWEINDKGELLYRRLEKSNIKVEFKVR